MEAPNRVARRTVVLSTAVDELELRGPADVQRLVELVRTLRERNRQLEHALGSRIVIEQAKGVLAERYRSDPERAFEVLRRAARNHRMKIHDLARTVVADRETPLEVLEALEAVER